MKVTFESKDREKIKADIKTNMGGRALGEMVDFAMRDGAMIVTISKLGTSTLTFDETETASGLEYNLAREKIALTHRAFKEEVTQKILDVIKRSGGKIG